MNPEVHQNAIKRITGLFDRPVIQNNLRGIYVEYLVAELLGQNWRVTSNDWAAWDIEHKDGTKIEVKQSASVQTWKASKRGYSPPRFSIRTPKIIWEGALAKPATKRLADIYVFAWHENSGDEADQRDVDQWKFYVLQEMKLPFQDTIGISSLNELTQPTKAENLARTVRAIRQRGMKQ